MIFKNNFLTGESSNVRGTTTRIVGLFFAVVFVAVSVVGFFYKGLNFGIDFTGGYITEFSTSEVVSQDQMRTKLTKIVEGKFILTSTTDQLNWTVRQPDSGEPKTSSSWIERLKNSSWKFQEGIAIEVMDSEFIGSQIGNELIEQGGLALLTALIMILLYLSARFEWRFALGSILALLHDVSVVLGIFAWFQLEFDLTVLASLLAIVGYSLNDSIIVSDRIRELMKHNESSSLNSIVNSAIHSTMTRTLITSTTTLVTISAIWFLAGSSLAGFSVALFAGILVGTLSSICISATFPVLIGLTADYYQKKDQELESELS
ncbi:MAG: protein translocase subunit SecF [Kangiellaceae bacterium]|nr:protein translocase subunit SecF [Kangiellaceae bacterium]